MATLDSPLEALALEYASFGCLAVVNNVWTWIAVVTVAVSFWRIRVTNTIKVEDGHVCGLASKAEQETGHNVTQEMAGTVEVTETAPANPTRSVEIPERVQNLYTEISENLKYPIRTRMGIRTPTSTVKETVVYEPLVCGDRVTKGKLTMYYEVDVVGERCVDGDGELTEVSYGGGLGDCGEWWERWERVLKMRTGDDDWYRYVDLTVLNGSVVRLWDDKRNP